MTQAGHGAPKTPLLTHVPRMHLGVAERFNITEGQLRRSLFEDTGGMYPELLTRHDLKTFLPPIGGMTVYIVSDYVAE